MSGSQKASNPIVALCDQLELAPFLIIDIGAGGKNAVEVKEISPICEVHAVDPRMDEGKSARDIAGFGKYVSHNTALSDHAGPQTLFITRIPEASSLLRPHKVNLERWRGKDSDFDVVEKRTVDCETLQAFSERAQLKRCDLLKIDTQGTELSILLSGIRLVSNTSIIAMEVEFVRLYEKQFLFDDAVRELSRLGFRYMNFTHGHSLGGLDHGTRPQKRIWADTLFLRDVPGTMSVQEVLRAAIILCQLGYEDEAIWFMQDHEVVEDTIGQIVDAFRARAVANRGFVSRKVIYPVLTAMRSRKLPGRSLLIKAASKVAFIRSLLSSLPYKRSR